MKDLICIVLVGAMLFAQGCGGRAAYPVQISQAGDYALQCNQLEAEMNRIRHEVQLKTGQKTTGDLADTALFAAGLVIFWPALFFMDLKNADKVELEALQSRYAHLVDIYTNKICN